MEDDMDLDKILARVDVERLYQHVLRLEGVKHPIDAPERLKQAGETIYAELEQCGLPVRVQEFWIEGWDEPFRNIEGRLGSEDEPAVVLINHYDTVSSTLGANDNAAGVAVMLEAARVLAPEPGVPAIRFVSATLEEGLPPTAKLRHRQSARRLGLTDERGRYTSYRVARIMKRHAELVGAAIEAGRSHLDAMHAAQEQLGAEMPEAVSEYLRIVEEAYAGLTTASAIGVTGKLGSSRWVDEALALGKKIQFTICLDEIGTTSKREHSQRLPAGVSYGMMQTYRVDGEREIGDWAFIIADPAAAEIAQAFCAHCRRESIDLAHAFFQMPGFEQIAERFPQAFGSDHAPFWRAGIPAIFAFDTANWRNPYGHSMADSIDRLDFEHITKLCKATIATAIDPALRGAQGPRSQGTR
jgi:hypothetical protein